MSKPVILITGGGRRIGAATSKLLMESGYYVLIHVRNSVELANQLIEAHSNENKCEPCGEVIVADFYVRQGNYTLAKEALLNCTKKCNQQRHVVEELIKCGKKL